jgi:hypothetical protein
MKLLQLLSLSPLFFLAGAANAVGAERGAYVVEAPNLRINISPEGKIVGIKLGSETTERPVTGETVLVDCRLQAARAARLADGGVEFHKEFVDKTGQHRGTLIERFLPKKDSMRWEIEVRGAGEPWSTPIETSLTWPEPDKNRFWTAWGDPRPNGTDWTNPLRPAQWTDREFLYGGHSYFKEPGTFSLPLATILDESRDTGLSLVSSPEDLVLTMKMRTTRQGNLTFSREHHRLGKGNVVRLAFDLAPHPADWRCGAAWLVRRYPAFFDPPNPKAHQMAGCGAYATDVNANDAQRLMRMAFRVNWKASFDFPYMGMFIPPVTSDTDEWTDFKREKTSIARMRASAQELRRMGFYLLNYFNVTEFGAHAKFPAPPRKAAGDADLWKDSNDFLHYVLGKAILPGPDGKAIGSWEGCVVMDCGEKVYRDFLVNQARRHIEKFPESSGICIDRMDWLWCYNRQRDDGVTWYEGRPARSLVVSWHELMHRIGPLMHDAGKVIFGNPMYARLDLMRQLDGFYDEHGQHPNSINTCSLLALNKPYIAWTWELEDIKKDPDAYFQRHLHLGAYLTAPVAGNDHTVLPDKKLDRLFFDYGPLLDALRGKRWVLLPHVVRVEGDKALANVFQTPGGYAMPVTFGGNVKSVTIRLRNIPKLDKLSGKALHPGDEAGVLVPAEFKDGVLELQVPMKRGCAMVVLTQN